MNLVHATKKYALYRDRSGACQITRIADGYEVFFQPGDDAAEMNDLADMPYVEGGIWDDDAQFDHIMSQYDDVMRAPVEG